ncbi:MAG: type II toxin-antitoxin system RelE/ParE family toxin [Caulobacter sp.]|nr:type II toxin-antitoxin system RelE/ParE family toxin [Caulobacter sp.]
MVQVTWTRRAVEDLTAIVAYISQFSPAAAQRISRLLKEAAASLAEHPDRGRLTSRGFRELVSVQPYILRYRIDAEGVRIARIRHSARRPLP